MRLWRHCWCHKQQKYLSEMCYSLLTRIDKYLIKMSCEHANICLQWCHHHQNLYRYCSNEIYILGEIGDDISTWCCDIFGDMSIIRIVFDIICYANDECGVIFSSIFQSLVSCQCSKIDRVKSNFRVKVPWWPRDLNILPMFLKSLNTWHHVQLDIPLFFSLTGIIHIGISYWRPNIDLLLKENINPDIDNYHLLTEINFH